MILNRINIKTKMIMENKMNKYEAPEVLIVECIVEKGYASSTASLNFSDEAEETADVSSWWWQ